MTFRSKKLFVTSSFFILIVLMLCVGGYWTIHSLPTATPHLDSVLYQKVLSFQLREDSLTRLNKNHSYTHNSPLWDSIQNRQKHNKQWQNRMQKGMHKHSKDYYLTQLVHLHDFNPNTIDSSQLSQIGLSPYIIHGMLSYRRAGGKFVNKQQMATLYGMDSIIYTQLEKYIQIPTLKNTIPKISLNSQDTNLWTQLPQIGLKRAVSIISYGKKLGAYVSKEQLKEVWSINDSLYQTIETYIVQDTIQIRPVYLNTTSFQQLFNHPYINYYQAEALFQLRNKLKHIDTIDQLKEIPEFSILEIQKLEPYLNFKQKK